MVDEVCCLSFDEKVLSVGSGGRSISMRNGGAKVRTPFPVESDLKGGRRGRFMPWAVALIGVIGPGIVVMLADTDAGSLITAAQSGLTWQA